MKTKRAKAVKKPAKPIILRRPIGNFKSRWTSVNRAQFSTAGGVTRTVLSSIASLQHAKHFHQFLAAFSYRMGTASAGKSKR